MTDPRPIDPALHPLEKRQLPHRDAGHSSVLSIGHALPALPHYRRADLWPLAYRQGPGRSSICDCCWRRPIPR